ncbi:50S ribosomal protein L14e [Candidatus Woesearchaeota archaeon]|nr:50S ribosomal protein L14e [Candidatus Woesearchaeota archaeon]
MIEIGRLCVKTAGRDAGLKCVIVDILDNKFVLIDGETRRRKCNILHLEPLKDVIKVKKNASHEDIRKEFEKLGLKAMDTKPKQKTERPVKQNKRELKEEPKKKKADAKKPAKREKETESGIEEKIGALEEKKKPKKSAKNAKQEKK